MIYLCPLCGGVPEETSEGNFTYCDNDNCSMSLVTTAAWKKLSTLRRQLDKLTEELSDARAGIADCTLCTFLGNGDPTVDEIAAIKEENAALRRAFVLAYLQDPVANSGE